MTSISYKFSNLLVPIPSVMDRYIATELIPPFLFGVGTFSSVGVEVGTAIDLVRKVVEAGLPLSTAFHVFWLNIPYYISLALPMSTLFAALMTYSRLSSNSELTAIRNCGVSTYRLVLPALFLSLFVAGMTFVLNEQVVPVANYQANLILKQALKKDKPTIQQNVFFPEYRKVQQSDGSKVNVLSRLFYASQFDGERMTDLTLVEDSPSGLHRIVLAKSAVWDQARNIWDFFNGTIFSVAPNSSYRNIFRFEHQQFHLPPIPLSLVSSGPNYGEMNIVQAYKYLNIVRQIGDDKKIRQVKAHIQEKFAFPFVCVVFGLVGSALGTRPQRTSRATSFGISIVIIFTYYLLNFVTRSLGLTGILSPWMSAWLPTMFGFGMGGWLLLRSAR